MSRNFEKNSNSFPTLFSSIHTRADYAAYVAPGAGLGDCMVPQAGLGDGMVLPAGLGVWKW